MPAEGEGEGEVDLVTLTLTVQGSGTTMPTAGEHVYEPGSSVYVYAAPETGWFFDRWEGDLEGIVNPFSQGIIFMMDGDRTLTAVFLPGDWLLEIAATEGGTTSPSPGVHAYLDESVVWLFADPDPGYAFDFWEGDLASTSQFDSITMDADKSVTAWFAPADWTLSVLHAGSGSGLTFPPDGAVEGFLDGRRTGIVLQGVNPGSYWGGWSGDAAGYESLAVVTMDQDRTVVANFSDSGYDLFIDSVGEGVTNLPPGTHALAEDATPVLTATPDMGWLFEEWQGDIGDGDPSSSTLNLLMDRDRSITAVFVESDIEGEGETPAEGETSIPHPADLNLDYRMVIQEAIAYLAGWQQGVNPLAYAIRAAYLWQNGEQYHYDAAQDPPLCWVLGPAAEEGEVPLEGEVPEGEGEVLPEGEGELPGEGEPVVVPGELVDVPAGTFQMGDPWNEGDGDEVPVHAVTLDAYRIGKYEVTNQEYANVLNWAQGQGFLTDEYGGAYTDGMIYAYNQPVADTETSNSRSQLTYSGGVFGVRSRDGHGGALYSMADHPMIEVTWYGAVCYCNWLSEQQGLQACYDTATWTRYAPVRNGYRLPTEAEWERAAAWDGSRHWRYGMTSDTIDITRANYYDWEYEDDYANPLGLTSWPYTSPVGWYNGVNPARVNAPGTLTVNGTSPVGAYDMSGNVWEWCHDWYDSAYFAGGAMTNPLGPSTGTSRVLRGGSWYYLGRSAYSANRLRSLPDYWSYYNGFRVAVSVSSR